MDPAGKKTGSYSRDAPLAKAGCHGIIFLANPWRSRIPRVALPCCYLTLRARKPRNPSYPENLKTLSDHVRQRRLDLGMHEKDVAALVNATTSTVTSWEKNRTRPTLEFLPRIAAFLRHDPISHPTSNLREIIRCYR